MKSKKGFKFSFIDLKRVIWRHPRFLRKLPWNKLVLIPLVMVTYQYMLAQRDADELRLKLQQNNNSNYQLFVAYTMWKFHNFSITQILREINFEDS